MKIIKKFRMARCSKVLYIISIPNGRIAFCGGHVVFE
jgi:hypothetical protein